MPCLHSSTAKAQARDEQQQLPGRGTGPRFDGPWDGLRGHTGSYVGPASPT